MFTRGWIARLKEMIEVMSRSIICALVEWSEANDVSSLETNADSEWCFQTYLKNLRLLAVQSVIVAIPNLDTYPMKPRKSLFHPLFFQSL